MKHLQCEFCDGGATETKFVQKTFERDGRKFTYTGIKAEVCRKCGARYFDGETMHIIENEINQETFATV